MDEVFALHARVRFLLPYLFRCCLRSPAPFSSPPSPLDLSMDGPHGIGPTKSLPKPVYPSLSILTVGPELPQQDARPIVISKL
ncbi:hypothetical protein NL676_031674 [Syzygium grande]|nr:hypothetical protein NL676_031674 [Syzygium grande]